VPLAAGVASGEVILAVAVLSILLTAPAGAIGITLMGNRVLDRGTQSNYRFKELRKKLGAPRVGERVTNRQTGLVWKIIEEREIWLENIDTCPDGPAFTPAILIRFWHEKEEGKPGTGKTIVTTYGHNNISFEDNWEILYDW
jgi:hypothetical protein